MPDADDFDVEYFRKLLKGDGPQDGATPADRPLPVARGKSLPVHQRPPATREGTPRKGRKKRGKR